MKKFIILYYLLPFILSAAEVPVLSKNLKFGEIIGESDVLYVEMESVDKYTVTSDKALIGKVLKANIEANKPIKQYQLRLQPVIKKNEQVDIVFVKDNVKLQSKGIALENGFDDGNIKVKSLYNSKNLVAKVVDQYSVRVD